MPHLTVWPLDLEPSKTKFHVKPSFKFTKMRLTGPERKLLRICGTQYQAFQDDARVTSSSEEYKHFMKVLEVYQRNSILSAEAFKEFMKLFRDSAELITEKERIWLKYQTMLKEEKRLKQQHEDGLIHSSERDEYIQSRFVP